MTMKTIWQVELYHSEASQRPSTSQVGKEPTELNNSLEDVGQMVT